MSRRLLCPCLPWRPPFTSCRGTTGQEGDYGILPGLCLPSALPGQGVCRDVRASGRDTPGGCSSPAEASLWHYCPWPCRSPLSSCPPTAPYHHPQHKAHLLQRAFKARGLAWLTCAVLPEHASACGLPGRGHSSQLTEEETEAQRGLVTCLGLYVQ